MVDDGKRAGSSVERAQKRAGAQNGRTIHKTPAARDTSTKRTRAIPLWHGRGVSRDLIELVRIFESIRRCVNSGSVSRVRRRPRFRPRHAKWKKEKRGANKKKGSEREGLKYLRAGIRIDAVAVAFFLLHRFN